MIKTLVLGFSTIALLGCATPGEYSSLRSILKESCARVGCPMAYTALVEECMEDFRLDEDMRKQALCLEMAEIGFEECPKFCRGVEEK